MPTNQTNGPLEDSVRRATPVSAPAEQHADIVALLEALAKAPIPDVLLADGAKMPLPESVLHLLKSVVGVLARGDAIALVPVGKELTTQQAADLLNVSRQYLVRLLEEGRIPCTKTGKHRRLRLDDVLAFKQTRNKQRKAKLDELTRLSEEARGYGELE
jgi:excisionase family DNA binding protein